jgi:Putative papain-like cysteine peptidase (DUF1796)
MNHIHISLGCQCTTSTLFEKIGVKGKSLPFDWMFSTPEFVYTILKLLLIDNMPVDEIVKNHFFACDKRATIKGQEHHVTDPGGSVLVNSTYMVCFPHNSPSDEDKYVRRLERLKNVILDKNNYLHFVYISVSSSLSGNYTVDGIEPIKDVYECIPKINDIIKNVTSAYKIVVFDTSKKDAVSCDPTHVTYIKIGEKNIWSDLLPEVIPTYAQSLQGNIQGLRERQDPTYDNRVRYRWLIRRLVPR